MSPFRGYFYKTSRANVFIFSCGIVGTLISSLILKQSLQDYIVSHKQVIAVVVAFLALVASLVEAFEENTTAPTHSKWVKPVCKGVTVLCGVIGIFVILLDTFPAPNKDPEPSKEKTNNSNNYIYKIYNKLDEISKEDDKLNVILEKISSDIESRISIQGNGPSQEEKENTFSDISSNLLKIEESQKRDHILLQHLNKKYEPQIVNRSECQTPHPCCEMPLCSYHP